MNFLKKKLKPLATGFSTAVNSNHHQAGRQTNKDLEDDLYDEYVVEAPPHPSELLALGVDPSQVDVNDPDKLRELYRKAKEEGKDKQTHSMLLAKQRQKEEIEEKKRTREEWKYFDSLTSRVDDIVKGSQKTLEQLKETSAVNTLTEPEYELRQTADEVFRPASAAKQEKVGEQDWIDFNEGSDKDGSDKTKEGNDRHGGETEEDNLVDEFGCPKRKTSLIISNNTNLHIAEELFEDFGLDLRSADQKKMERLRPRPAAPVQEDQSVGGGGAQKTPELDPFDTSFIDNPTSSMTAAMETVKSTSTKSPDLNKSDQERPEEKYIDPFDTSYVNL